MAPVFQNKAEWSSLSAQTKRMPLRYKKVEEGRYQEVTVIRNSRLPLGPRIGEGTTPLLTKP
jgi:hypothetical protein